MIVHSYLLLLPSLLLCVDSSSIRGRNNKNELVPSGGSRLDGLEKKSHLKLVSDEPFFVRLQVARPNDSKQTTERQKKRKRQGKKRVSKLRKKHRTRRDLLHLKGKQPRREKPNPTTEPPPDRIPVEATENLKNQTKNLINRTEILKVLSSYPKTMESNRTEVEEDSERGNKTQTEKQKGQKQGIVRMSYPGTPKPDRHSHRYTYKDLMADRKRLEQKISYIKNMLSTNNSDSEDAVRIRRRSESDRTANRIAKMFLTLSAVHDKRRPKCREGEEDGDDRVQDVWEKERRNSPNRKASSSNEERYKVKKWIEFMKNKRSSGKTCPCLGGLHGDDSDAFPLEQKLPKDYFLMERRGSSEESSEIYRDPYHRPRDRYSKGRFVKETPENKLKGLTKNGKKKLELPLNDLELYRSRAKQILQNAEEILDKIKEEEEKRLSAPNILMSQLKELTSRIQSDPRSNENDLIRKIQKNLGWHPLAKAKGGSDAFVDNVKTYFLDPYEKAKALTDESAKMLSSYLLRNLGKMQDSSEEATDSGGDADNPQVYFGKVPTKPEEKLLSASLAKEDSKADPLARVKQESENWDDTISSILQNGDGTVKEELDQRKKQEEIFKNRMEDIMKEQEKKLSEYATSPHSGESSQETANGEKTKQEKGTNGSGKHEKTKTNPQKPSKYLEAIKERLQKGEKPDKKESPKAEPSTMEESDKEILEEIMKTLEEKDKTSDSVAIEHGNTDQRVGEAPEEHKTVQEETNEGEPRDSNETLLQLNEEGLNLEKGTEEEPKLGQERNEYEQGEAEQSSQETVEGMHEILDENAEQDNVALPHVPESKPKDETVGKEAEQDNVALPHVPESKSEDERVGKEAEQDNVALPFVPESKSEDETVGKEAEQDNVAVAQVPESKPEDETVGEVEETGREETDQTQDDAVVGETPSENVKETVGEALESSNESIKEEATLLQKPERPETEISGEKSDFEDKSAEDPSQDDGKIVSLKDPTADNLRAVKDSVQTQPEDPSNVGAVQDNVETQPEDPDLVQDSRKSPEGEPKSEEVETADDRSLESPKSDKEDEMDSPNLKLEREEEEDEQNERETVEKVPTYHPADERDIEDVENESKTASEEDKVKESLKTQEDAEERPEDTLRAVKEDEESFETDEDAPVQAAKSQYEGSESLEESEETPLREVLKNEDKEEEEDDGATLRAEGPAEERKEDVLEDKNDQILKETNSEIPKSEEETPRREETDENVVGTPEREVSSEEDRQEEEKSERQEVETPLRAILNEEEQDSGENADETPLQAENPGREKANDSESSSPETEDKTLPDGEKPVLKSVNPVEDQKDETKEDKTSEEVAAMNKLDDEETVQKSAESSNEEPEVGAENSNQEPEPELRAENPTENKKTSEETPLSSVENLEKVQQPTLEEPESEEKLQNSAEKSGEVLKEAFEHLLEGTKDESDEETPLKASKPDQNSVESEEALRQEAPKEAEREEETPLQAMEETSNEVTEEERSNEILEEENPMETLQAVEDVLDLVEESSGNDDGMLEDGGLGREDETPLRVSLNGPEEGNMKEDASASLENEIIEEIPLQSVMDGTPEVSQRAEESADDSSNQIEDEPETPLQSARIDDSSENSLEVRAEAPLGENLIQEGNEEESGGSQESSLSDLLQMPEKSPKAGKLKVPKSIGKIMRDLDGKEKDDITSIRNLNPDKIDHIIGKIGEAEQQNLLEAPEVDCRKECACADEIDTRSRNIGRYEIVKDFLHWMKEVQLNRVLSDD